MNFDSPIARILFATAISTAVLGFGLRGKREPPRQGVLEANLQRRIRWLFVFTGILCSLMTFYVAQVSSAFALPGPTASTTVAAMILFGLIGGIIMLRFGLRGRWVGDHPYCNRCGFDLFGKPAESTTCNECGADLNGQSAVVIGVRQRRLVPALSGAFLITLSIAIAISLGRNSVTMLKQFSLSPYKPTWWLVRNFDSGTIDTQGGYELYTRLLKGKLDAETIEHIAALKPGAQPSQWSMTIARMAWSKGELSEATMRAHIRARLAYKAVVDDSATPTRIGFTVLSPATSVYLGRDPAWNLDVVGRRCEINDVELPASAVHTTTSRMMFTRRLSTTDEKKIGDVIRLSTASPLPLGTTKVKLAETLVGTLAVPGQPILTESVDLTLLDVSTDVVETLPVQPPTDATSDELLQETIACTARFDQHSDNTMDVTITLKGGDTQMLINDTIYVRADGADTKIGTIKSGTDSVTALIDGAAPKGVVEIVAKPANTLQPGFVLPRETAVPEIVFHAPVIERVHTR